MAVQIPAEIISDLELKLQVKVNGFAPSTGGCINNGGRLEASGGQFFLKWNELTAFPGMFETEANGLKLLTNAKAIRVAEVVLRGDTNSHQYLVLEFINSKTINAQYWSTFGRQLAMLHKSTNIHFGLDHDNYIGSLRQFNRLNDNWSTFFMTQRLEKMAELAVNKGLIDHSLVSKFQILYKSINTILTDEKPALLHGDLWAGNLIIDSSGNPCVIDPSVYYGNRETDLAMTTLFGGFDHRYLEAYNEEFPLISGYQSRFRVYQLYPLMVHLNLFGKSYLPRVVSILDDFV
jgi:protein-ribulosamine 3-kinase